MNHQKVYVMRVDSLGVQYAGYIAEMSGRMYEDLEIDPEWMEQIAFTDELTMICNREGAVMGLPLNRALYDASGNLVTVVGGNLLVTKNDAGTVCDVCADDVALIESRLRAIFRISHGLVFKKTLDELPEWKGKND